MAVKSGAFLKGLFKYIVFVASPSTSVTARMNSSGRLSPVRISFFETVTVVAPFALVMHVPASVILGKPLFGWPLWAAFVTPLSGPALFGLMVLLFSRAMAFYRSAGS